MRKFQPFHHLLQLICNRVEMVPFAGIRLLNCRPRVGPGRPFAFRLLGNAWRGGVAEYSVNGEGTILDNAI